MPAKREGNSKRNSIAMSEAEPNGSSYRDSAGNGSAETETETRETMVTETLRGIDTADTGIARHSDGKWMQGQSANPSGRSQTLQSYIKLHIGSNGREVVDLLVSVLRREAGPAWRHPKWVSWAAMTLLDRGWGKSLQAVSGLEALTAININVLGPQLPEASSGSTATETSDSDTVSLQLSVSEPQGSFFSEKG